MSLFHSSVASITASLHTMVAKLEGHAADQRAKADKHRETAVAYFAKQAAALTEAAQAERVREKLQTILD